QVYACEEVSRKAKADLLRSSEVDHEFKECRLLYRQFAWFGSFDDLIYIAGCPPPECRVVLSVAEQCAMLRVDAGVGNRCHAVLQGELRNLFYVTVEKAARQNDDGIDVLLRHRAKGR